MRPWPRAGLRTSGRTAPSRPRDGPGSRPALDRQCRSRVGEDRRDDAWHHPTAQPGRDDPRCRVTAATPRARRGGVVRPAVGRDGLRDGRRSGRARGGGVDPHWPVTAVEALATIALGLVVGCIAGAALRSRRALLLVPVTFLAVFEIVRIGATGPTVDAPTTVNAIALHASPAVRIVYGVLVAVVPMLLGAAYGRSWALRRSPAGSRRPPAADGRADRASRRRRRAGARPAGARGRDRAARGRPTRSWAPTALRWPTASPRCPRSNSAATTSGC